MNLTASTSVRDAAGVIFKYWKMIVSIVFLTVLIVTAGSYILPEIYEAHSKILVKFGRQSAMADSVIQRPTNPAIYTGSVRQEDIASEAEVLSSELLIRKTLQAIGEHRLAPPLTKGKGWFAEIKYEVKIFVRNLSATIREFMQRLDLTQPITDEERLVLKIKKSLSVSPIRNTNVIEIAFRWPIREVSAEFLHKLIELYLDYYITIHKEQQMLGFLGARVNQAKTQLSATEQAIETFKQEQGIISLNEQRSLLLNREAGLESMLQDTKQQIAEVDGKLEVLGNEPTVNQILRREHLLLKANRRGLHGKKRVLEGELHLLQKRLTKLDAQEITLARLSRQLKIDEENYILYQNKHEELHLSEMMDRSKIIDLRVIEPAAIPIRPLRFIRFLPRKIFNILTAFFASFLVAITLAFVRDYFDHTLNNKRKVEQYLELPLLATVPNIR